MRSRSVAAAPAAPGAPRARGAFRASAALPVLLIAGFAAVQRLALPPPTSGDTPRAGISADRARARSADLCRAVSPAGAALSVGAAQPYFSGRGDGWDVDCTVNGRNGREVEYVRMSWDGATGRLTGIDGGDTGFSSRRGAGPRPLKRTRRAAEAARAVTTALRPDIVPAGAPVTARRFGDNWIVLLGAPGGARATVSLAADDGALRFARFSPEPGAGGRATAAPPALVAHR